MLALNIYIFSETFRHCSNNLDGMRNSSNTDTDDAGPSFSSNPFLAPHSPMSPNEFAPNTNASENAARQQ